MSTTIDQPPTEQRPLACDLTAIAPERRAGHQALAARLFGVTASSPIAADGQRFSEVASEVAEERRELPDGFAWRFAGEQYPEVAAFVDNERRCCPFLTFTLTLAPDGGPLWLHLTGSGEIKRLLQAELGLAPAIETTG